MEILIVVGIILWCVTGIWGLVYNWRKDFDFTSSQILLVVFCGPIIGNVFWVGELISFIYKKVVPKRWRKTGVLFKKFYSIGEVK